MAKDEKKEAPPPDGPFEVAGVRKAGQYEVVLRTRTAGKVVEEVIKSTPDWRIAADRLTEAMDTLRRGGAK